MPPDAQLDGVEGAETGQRSGGTRPGLCRFGGPLRDGEVDMAVAGDAPSLRSGIETRRREWCLAFSVIS